MFSFTEFNFLFVFLLAEAVDDVRFTDDLSATTLAERIFVYATLYSSWMTSSGGDEEEQEEEEEERLVC